MAPASSSPLDLPCPCRRGSLMSSLLWALAFSCLALLVSKLLGYGIIVGSLTIKLPQIMKIANAKSAKESPIPCSCSSSSGSLALLSSVHLDGLLIASHGSSYVVTMIYSYLRGFPFSTYGETVFMAVQSAPSLCLLLLFSVG